MELKEGTKKLQEAVAKAIASGLSEEQVLKAIELGQLAQKHSAKNPYKREPAVPSYVEDAINKVLNVRQVLPEKEFFIGPQPGADAQIEAILDRKQIVETARTLTDRVSPERIQRYADVFFNDGFNIETIKKIAVLDTSRATTDAVSDIIDSAGVEFPTIDDAEAIAYVARSILKHVMTHHKGDVKYVDTVTPFMAWRVKERIVNAEN